MADRYSKEHDPDRDFSPAMVMVVDMSPSTILDENVNRGLRPNKPVGTQTTKPRDFSTSGNTHLGDTEAARRLGATGKN